MLLGATMLFYSACRKQTDSTQSPDSFAASAKSWFQKEIVQKEKDMLAKPLSILPKDAYSRIFARMGKLNDLMNWNEARQYNQNGLYYLLYWLNNRQSL